jgi:hypothetical protein
MVLEVPFENSSVVSFGDEDVEEDHADEQRDHQETASADNNLDFSGIKPVSRNSGGRTVSTQARLRRQGLRNSKSGEGGTNFVVQSIRRGSEDWRGLSKSEGY